MNILFVIDKIEHKYFEFNDLVTNFWMIKEFVKNKHNVDITTINKLSLNNSVPFSLAQKVLLDNENIFYEQKGINKELDTYDLIFFRPDPPVDNNYINATYIFDFVKKAKVYNSPFAIRNFNEKLHTLMFQEYMPQSIVTASLQDIEHFLDCNKEIILKPLNKCFGSGVFYLKQGDKNTRSIINTVTENESMVIMAQKYLSAGQLGDKRVLTLGKNVLEYCITKHPTKDDFKFNTHSNHYITASKLTPSEKTNFTKVAEKLNALGIVMAGLDVIDGKIIEINVTSPCYFIKEINNLHNIKLNEAIYNFFIESPCYNAKNIV